MIPATEIRDALSADLVIARYGLRAKKRGSQYRLVECPRCRGRSTREAIAIDAKTGQWLHHGFERAAGGTCSGDVLDLIAACEDLDCKRDFRRIMDIAAEIAGVVHESEIERDIRIRAQKERARVELTAEIERRVASRSTAAAAWDALSTGATEGAAYLATRGLLPSADVRYGYDGIVVAIRDADGYPISTATRLYEPGDRPKVLALRGHSTKGTMIDAACDIVHGRDVVVTEGIIDSLTARAAWPRAVVLGANGAGQLPRLVESIIGRVKLATARLFLVPHNDEQGIRAMTTAGQVALAAGLELDQSLLIQDLGEHKDLNAAWCAGWRPTAEGTWQP